MKLIKNSQLIAFEKPYKSIILREFMRGYYGNVQKESNRKILILLFLGKVGTTVIINIKHKDIVTLLDDAFIVFRVNC